MKGQIKYDIFLYKFILLMKIDFKVIWKPRYVFFCCLWKYNYFDYNITLWLKTKAVEPILKAPAAFAYFKDAVKTDCILPMIEYVFEILRH